MRRIIDVVISIWLLAAAPALILFSKKRSKSFPLTGGVLKKMGLFIIPDSYYYPLFNSRYLRHDLSNPRHLPGLKLNIAQQITFLGELDYYAEVMELFAASNKLIYGFEFGNGSFEAGDAEFLYQFCRYTKPSRVIEIGSGNSTRIVAKALERNRQQGSCCAQHICIEPYENTWLSELPVELIREPVQNVSLERFESLESGDLLFIDSSHIIRPQGDVLFEYQEVLPILKSGVFIHIHDIFTPKDYLREFIVDKELMWNEQYLVEAILQHSNRYEIVASLNYLQTKHHGLLARVCPFVTESNQPGSLYLRVI